MAMLEIRNVQKTFRTYAKPGLFHRPGARKVISDLPVLRGVDLTVEKGDVVAILGPSGSGKTTLLRCLNFLETADAGQLVFDGESFDLAHASRADIARLRKKTAFVFQNYNLFRNKTALQNVTEGLIVARKLPKEQADEIGIRMTAAMHTQAPAAQTASTFSPFTKRISQLPPMRPAMNSPMPPNDSHTEASCAETPAFSVA